jgi:inward rectifier potassium channel
LSERGPREERATALVALRRGLAAADSGGRRPDLYHRLLTVRWSGFFAAMAAAYFAFNLLFALLYLLEPGSIANAGKGSFGDAFFFSVQTMATIGYGDMRPATLYGNLLVTVEVLLGLAGFALATGIIFARFSRPTARVLFSNVAVVTRHEGVPTLMFRAANQRLNRIFEAQINMSVARNEITAEGVAMRRFYDLKPERARTPLFVLTWTVMHRIDEASPLYGATREQLRSQDAQIIVTLAGTDETLSQQIHSRHVYDADAILWGRRLADIMTLSGDGQTFDYRRFHDTVAPPES